MPKVSVVIPTYNRAHLIGETIQSVLDQTFRDFEVLIIDDGSTDNTFDTVSSFPVRYLWQENKGPSAARNRGVELAQGDYIAFVDSDDVLLERALEKGVEALDAHPEVAFSYGQWYIMDENHHTYSIVRSSFRHRSPVLDGKEIIREMLSSYLIPLSTTMVRRCCMQAIGGFNEEMRISEDRALHINLARKYPAAYVAEPLIKYRVHSGGLSASPRLKEMETNNILILESIFNDKELGPIFSHLRPNAYFHVYFVLAVDAYSCGMVKTARDYLCKALRANPKVFLTRAGVTWIFLLGKSFVPPHVLALARRSKRYLIPSSGRIP